MNIRYITFIKPSFPSTIKLYVHKRILSHNCILKIEKKVYERCWTMKGKRKKNKLHLLFFYNISINKNKCLAYKGVFT